MFRTRRAMSLLLACSAALCPAQQYVISTYAGGAPLPTPAPATAGTIGAALGVAADAGGNVYFASADLNSVFKLDQSGVLTRVAGDSRPGYSGDGGPATSARLRLDWQIGAAVLGGVAVDSAGNLFIADTGNGCIRRVSPSGIITTVAGNGTVGYSGDGGPATNAQLNLPAGVAVDGAGNLFIADHWAVRRVSASGIITTVAGNGALSCSSADGGPATSAALAPMGVAVDSAGNLFIVSALWPSPGTSISCGGIRKVSPSGIITTVAGGGSGVAVDDAGNLFIAEGTAIRRVSTSGIATTVAGNGTFGFSGDGGPATNAQLNGTSGMAVDDAGNLFIASAGRIRKVSTSGIITTVAGNGTFGPRLGGSSFSGDGGPATSAQLGNWSGGVAVDGGGNLFIADLFNFRIRKVSPNGIITTAAGNGTRGSSGDGGPATSAQLGNWSGGVAVDGGGNLFIADPGNNRIRKVSPSGIITTVAGNGTQGFSGDDGPAATATLWGPTGVAVDSASNLFIADAGNDRIRKVAPSGIITTVAGGGTLSGPAADGGPATSAQLTRPGGVAVDAAGNLFIVDGFRCYGPRCYGAIRKVSTGGNITTVAGGGTLLGSSGDGGPATSAHLSWPAGVAVDSAGNLFIADPGANFSTGGEYSDDPGDHRIRKVSPSGIITTVAGTGSAGFTGDGGPAAAATLYGPTSLAVDSGGNVYVADAGNAVVRILRPTNHPLLIGAVVDAASQRADPVSPGKIVVVYGAGLGPSQLIQNRPSNGQFGTELAGTVVSFNGIAAPILYTSATQVAAVTPYAVSGTTAQVMVSYRGEVSAAFPVPVAASAPSLFTLNQAGWGQAAAIHADGTPNTAANPVRIGGFISLYATGEGQTGSATPPRPVLPVSVTVGGIPATVQYAGSAPGQVGGLMQVNVQIPSGVQPGGYVPVVLQVGDRSSSSAVWIAVAGN